MIKKEPTRQQKKDVVLYLRCVETYAEYICDHVDDANALDYYEFDDVVEETIGVKASLNNLLIALFGKTVD